LKQNKGAQATAAACSYRTAEIVGVKDIIYAHMQLQTEGKLIEKRNRARNAAQPVDETRPLRERLRNLTVQTPAATEAAIPGIGSEILYHTSRTNWFGRMGQLFSDPRCRRALLAASVAMLAQVLSGVNVFGQ
jgi:hypothetical protein